MASLFGVSARNASSGHEGFLAYAGYRWLKIALALSFIAVMGYALADVEPRPNGGSWMGYSLGTIGAGLIVWLSVLGIRKRAITPGQWSLKAWTSAHVYLGLSLIIIATLHTGFQFGWNIHTLAYALMMLVILSGIYGISVYANLPVALSNNRQEMTQPEMLESLRSIDRQLHDTAQPLPQETVEYIFSALEENPFQTGLFRRLSGHYPHCATRAAIHGIAHWAEANPKRPEFQKLESLLGRRSAILDRMRRHMRLKALLEVWLYIHIPATIALLAALTAHIVSVFYYW